MADDAGAAGVKGRVSAEEWQARVDLAAVYRLVALHGWDDMIFTHISMRVPGPEHHFLINPYGMLFGEMKASDLVKVDLEGQIVSPTSYFINAAGFTIHSAIHAAREDAICVIHLHTDHGTAVAAQKEGLLPLTQHGLIALPQVAYHDYEGIALNLDERERLVKDLGDKRLMILRNHGTLAVGASGAEAFMGIYYLERACAQQVMALSAGRDKVLIAPEAAQTEVKGQTPPPIMAGASRLAWPGLLRRLERESPGYDA
jgi:ribulose-5-phosphate 4-epimerase/fuculose-1-phosphate aldolase